MERQINDWVSPKQAARAIGVSESSLKRWCDQGLLKSVRTAGGHRKMSRGEVLDFARRRNQPLASPEVLGLPPASEHSALGLVRGKKRLTDALVSGEELLARQIVFDLYMAQHSFSQIFDEVIAKSFEEIGDLWDCHDIAIYQERRACEICSRILFEIRKTQGPQTSKLLAIGGTIEGDRYSLPQTMAELVLRESGFNAISLGISIPFDSLIRAVEENKPTLFWLSVSHIEPGMDFVKEFDRLSQVCSQLESAIVVGGRALTDELRQKMTYSAHCDTMQHLEGFAKTISRTIEKSSNIQTPEDASESS